MSLHPGKYPPRGYLLQPQRRRSHSRDTPDAGTRTPSSAEPPSQSSASAAAEQPGSNALIGLTDGKSAAQYWDTHPGAAPGVYASSTMIIDAQEQGPQSFELPNHPRYTHISVVIICDSESAYTSTLKKGDSPVYDSGGESCGGAGITTATSAALSAEDYPDNLAVSVPEGVSYWVSVFGGDNRG